MRRHSIARATILVVLAACGGDSKQASSSGAVSSTPQPSAAGGPLTVTVVPAHAAMAGRTVSVPGELRPFQDARLYPRVSGFVREVLVDRGAHVRQGQVLARLEAPELNAQIAEAGSRVQAAEASMAEAQARYQGSRATYDRLRTAARTSGIVAPDELERAQRLAQADSARLTASQAQVNAARSSERAVAQTGSYLDVVAPFDGTITERDVSVGALVGPSGGAAASPVFSIEDVSHLRLVVALPEAYVGSVAPTGQASFQVKAFPTETFHAALARRAGTLDARTRSESMEFDVANSNGRLKAGMYADVLVPMARPTPTFVVPSTAVATSVDGPFVIAIIGDTTHWVRVRKGDTVGDGVEVFGDLREGEPIAMRGTEEIRTGTRVRAVAPK